MVNVGQPFRSNRKWPDIRTDRNATDWIGNSLKKRIIFSISYSKFNPEQSVITLGGKLEKNFNNNSLEFQKKRNICNLNGQTFPHKWLQKSNTKIKKMQWSVVFTWEILSLKDERPFNNLIGLSPDENSTPSSLTKRGASASLILASTSVSAYSSDATTFAFKPNHVISDFPS